MARRYQQLRVLLFQIRDDRASLLQERACFIDRCGLPEESFRWVNLVDEPRFRLSDLSNEDAVIIGGAGSFSVTSEYPFTPWLRDVVLELMEQRRPLFGSCWGHQFMALCGGGEVETDLDREEIGSFEIRLNERGVTEPIFEGFPSVFVAQLGHHDRVTSLGDGWVELAYSERCANQVIRFEDAPIISTQFHPELTEAALRERLAMYVQEYLPAPESWEGLLRSLKPSPEAESLLERFLRIYALGA